MPFVIEVSGGDIIFYFDFKDSIFSETTHKDGIQLFLDIVNLELILQIFILTTPENNVNLTTFFGIQTFDFGLPSSIF